MTCGVSYDSVTFWFGFTCPIHGPHEGDRCESCAWLLEHSPPRPLDELGLDDPIPFALTPAGLAALDEGEP